MAIPSRGGSEAYRQIIREISDRIVEAQRPIRVLDAIKWDDSVREAFFAAGRREQPPVDRAYYEARPLGFDVVKKREEFQDIEREIQRRLGQFNPIGAIMRRMCREYRSVIRMLDSRGLPEFSRLSRELYGSAGDVFHAGDPTLADLGTAMFDALGNIDERGALNERGEEKSIAGEQAVAILQERLDKVFTNGGQKSIRVILSDGIIADAAAGSDYIKIRKEATFNERDLRLLEVHEGWVHVATTLNGAAQSVCTFLSKGPPSSTITQEGLAIFVEILCFASHPARLRRLANRVEGVRMVEEGATFVEVFHFFREQGFSDQESFTNASRIFRGSLPTSGPFTKDLSYSKGFVLVYNYVQLAVRRGLLERIPLLFCGKTTLEDMGALAHLADEGLIEPPKYLPPPIADIRALSAWMCYSLFLNRLNLEGVEADYAGLLFPRENKSERGRPGLAKRAEPTEVPTELD
jgi:uncharacterized protein (TIGR02421 family)